MSANTDAMSATASTTSSAKVIGKRLLKAKRDVVVGRRTAAAFLQRRRARDKRPSPSSAEA